MVVFTFDFDLSKIGYLSPGVLGSILYTILQHPIVTGRIGTGRIGNMGIILSAYIMKMGIYY